MFEAGGQKTELETQLSVGTQTVTFFLSLIALLLKTREMLLSASNWFKYTLYIKYRCFCYVFGVDVVFPIDLTLMGLKILGVFFGVWVLFVFCFGFVGFFPSIPIMGVPMKVEGLCHNCQGL